MNDIDSIRFECPHCDKRLRVAAKAAGKRVRCPKCTKLVVVPDQSEAEELSDPAASRLLWPWLAGSGAVLVLLVGLGIWLTTGTKKQPDPSGSPQVAAGPRNASNPLISEKEPEKAAEKEPEKPKEVAGGDEKKAEANPEPSVKPQPKPKTGAKPEMRFDGLYFFDSSDNYGNISGIPKPIYTYLRFYEDGKFIYWYVVIGKGMPEPDEIAKVIKHDPADIEGRVGKYSIERDKIIASHIVTKDGKKGEEAQLKMKMQDGVLFCEDAKCEFKKVTFANP